MQLSRRDFLKLSTPATGLLILGRVPILERVAPTSSSAKAGKAMLYDSTRCVGCRACQAACRGWNKLPPESIGYGRIYDNPSELSGRTWTLIKAREFGVNGNKELLFLKHQCMHCSNASCVAVCPTGAAHKEGVFTVIDQGVCIGCGYCVAACPFEAVHKSHETGTARKCTLCIDRVTQGLKPACVEACPAGALIFGDRAEVIDMGKGRLQTFLSKGKREARLYGETELGGLGVMYALPEPASVFGLPDKPRVATTNVFTRWLSGVVAAGVLAVIPFWLLFRRRIRGEA